MIKSSRADVNFLLAGRGRLMGVCQATAFVFISVLGEAEMPAACKHLVWVVPSRPPCFLHDLLSLLL